MSGVDYITANFKETGKERITQHRGAFVQLFLQWKSSK